MLLMLAAIRSDTYELILRYSRMDIILDRRRMAAIEPRLRNTFRLNDGILSVFFLKYFRIIHFSLYTIYKDSKICITSLSVQDFIVIFEV